MNQLDDEQHYNESSDQLASQSHKLDEGKLNQINNNNGIKHNSYGHQSYNKQLPTCESVQNEGAPMIPVEDFLKLGDQKEQTVLSDYGFRTEDSNQQQQGFAIISQPKTVESQQQDENYEQYQPEYQQHSVFVDKLENKKQDNNAEENNKDQHKNKSVDMGDQDNISSMQIEHQKNNGQEQGKEYQKIGNTDSKLISKQDIIPTINKKIQKNKKQFSKEKKSKYWDANSKDNCDKFFSFISKESMWKYINKQAPNLIVYLICNYDQEMNPLQWQEIVKELSQEYNDKDSKWVDYFSLDSKIKLIKENFLKGKEDYNIITSQLKPKEGRLLSYKWNNFKTLCKDREINLNLENKETETFKNIEDGLNKQLNNQNIEKKQKQYIESLQCLINQIKYHKEKEFTKKTIDFTITDIYNLSENIVLKQQVELIFQCILSGSKQFLTYISTGDAELDNKIPKHLKMVVEKVQKMRNRNT